MINDFVELRKRQNENSTEKLPEEEQKKFWNCRVEKLLCNEIIEHLQINTSQAVLNAVTFSTGRLEMFEQTDETVIPPREGTFDFATIE